MLFILKKKFWEKLIAYVHSYDTDGIENDTSNNSYIMECVYVAAVKFYVTVNILWQRTISRIGRSWHSPDWVSAL
jgi:hypothetical protein